MAQILLHEREHDSTATLESTKYLPVSVRKIDSALTNEITIKVSYVSLTMGQ